MADDVAITAGSGTNIATDDCTSGHVQLMKLAYSADGSRTHVTADADGLLVNLGTNNDVTVSGVSTAANQSTIIGHLDGVEGLLTTIDADTGTLAGAVSGTEMQVDVVGALPAGTNNIGDVDVLSIAAGTNYIGRVRLTDGSNDQAVGTNGGAAIAGCTAHDTADAGSPVKIGAKAIAHGANPTAVTAADRTDLYANRAGVLFTIGGHPNTITSSIRLTGSSTDAAVIAGTISAGTKIVVTRLSVNVSNATTVNVGVKVGFGASTLPADSTTGAAGVLIDSDGFPPGGGVNVGDGSGIIGVGGDGEELRITNDAPTSGSLHVTCSYYTIES